MPTSREAAIDDSTKAHTALAFDKAHKSLFEIPQDTKRANYSEYLWIASACSTLSAAMKWLYFNKPTASPWKTN